MLLVANLVNTKLCRKKCKMTETQAYRYSSERTQQELSNEYQYDRVQIVFKNLCFLVLLDECSLIIGNVNMFCKITLNLDVSKFQKQTQQYREELLNMKGLIMGRTRQSL